ncbi:hypothetical protein [Fulvivirga lutea]|uniref:Uncharacterized protein n=1 Tax=Fulvivirga lutea TaxID=2810512 RepID=A0A974WKX4_9BACT|nr:hypothetical protein [Fulvivirga lutea]QSE97263.1 hypothetical protein JR347_16990 [Fulvivirga lutea]
MAKRKNPLKDLDAFLKQEAKSFVEPKKVAKDESAAFQSPPPVKEESESAALPLNENSVKSFLKALKAKGDEEFLDLLLSVAEESDKDSSKSKMLINTLLYLKDQKNWKENIKAYWS